MEKLLNERHRLRLAYIEFCGGFRPEYFLTLATNQSRSVAGLRALLGKFCGRVDRKLLGHEWTQTPAAMRTDGIFFVEHVASNIHLHGMLRFPGGAPVGLEMLTALVWRKICPSGTSNFSPTFDVAGCARYCTKEMLLPDYADEQIILVRDLMNEAAHNTI